MAAACSAHKGTNNNHANDRCALCLHCFYLLLQRIFTCLLYFFQLSTRWAAAAAVGVTGAVRTAYRPTDAARRRRRPSDPSAPCWLRVGSTSTSYIYICIFYYSFLFSGACTSSRRSTSSLHSVPTDRPHGGGCISTTNTGTHFTLPTFPINYC